MADCHPDRKHWAKGLCRECWDKSPSENIRKLELSRRPDQVENRKNRYQLKRQEILEKQKQYSMSSAGRLVQLRRRCRRNKGEGITVEQYHQILKDQDGLCAICKTFMNPPHIDHCHSSGKVRGLLCNDCNTSLGKFKESAENLRRAARYIDRLFEDGSGDYFNLAA